MEKLKPDSLVTDSISTSMYAHNFSLFLRFHCRKPDGTVACQAFHLVLAVTLPPAPAPGEGPGMNHLLLRHATPLALLPALAAPQDFTAGYCSCQWGRERGMFAQTRSNSLRHPHMHTFYASRRTPNSTHLDASLFD